MMLRKSVPGLVILFAACSICPTSAVTKNLAATKSWLPAKFVKDDRFMQNIRNQVDPKSSEEISSEDLEILKAPRGIENTIKRAEQYSEESAEDTAKFNPDDPSQETSPDCQDLSDELKTLVRSYKEDVERIIQYVMEGAHRNQTYEGLAAFVDTFGSRLTGTENLENAIDYMMEKARKDGFDSVVNENVTVPHWIRHEESATMVSPRRQTLTMLGLGGSVGTPVGGLEAEVVLVNDYDQLALLGAEQVQGKIVVYNQVFEYYGQSVAYRTQGAIEAAKLGAVASLVRSVTDFSINSPHTGSVKYQDDTVRIPSAAITVEDAAMIERLVDSGQTVTVHLTMGAELLADTWSRNTLIDMAGRERPEDFVVVSGHIDSWDVGAGAEDDAGGFFVGYHAALVLRRLGLYPRRTLRTILFTAEEQGLYGGQEYFNRHVEDKEHYQLILESDEGTFTPRGLGMYGPHTAMCIMQEALQLTAALNTTELVVSKDGPDIGFWMDADVPIGSLHQAPNNYFWYHHTNGDRMEIEDPRTLDKITAMWAAMAYVAADIDVDFQDFYP